MTEIKEVILLVHPLFTPLFESRYHSLFPTFRANNKFLLGLWGKKLIEAEQRPNTIVIMIHPYLLPRNFRTNDPIIKNLERFAAAIKRRLKDRFFLVKGEINPADISKEIYRRGFSISKRISGRAFGEYWEACVSTEAGRLIDALRNIETLPTIDVVRELSLGVLESEGSLGFYNENLRKVSVKKRRRVRRGRK